MWVSKCWAGQGRTEPAGMLGEGFLEGEVCTKATSLLVVRKKRPLHRTGTYLGRDRGREVGSPGKLLAGLPSASRDQLVGAGGELRVPFPCKAHVNSDVVTPAATSLASVFLAGF